MADARYIKTSIWKDEWFVSLRGDEQRLFLYLITNNHANIIGIYPITLREMAFDTGIDAEEVKRIFRDRFEPDGRAFYEIGWVVMKNWLKNQNLNPNMLKNAEKCFNEAPSWLRQRLVNPSDTIYIPFRTLLKRFDGFETLKEIEVEGEVEIEVEVRRGKRKGNGETAPGRSGKAGAGVAGDYPTVLNLDEVQDGED